MHSSNRVRDLDGSALNVRCVQDDGDKYGNNEYESDRDNNDGLKTRRFERTEDDHDGKDQRNEACTWQ